MNNKELTGVASLKAGDGMTYSCTWSRNPQGAVKISGLRRLIQITVGHIEVDVEIGGIVAKELQEIIEVNVK